MIKLILSVSWIISVPRDRRMRSAHKSATTRDDGILLPGCRMRPAEWISAKLI